MRKALRIGSWLAAIGGALTWLIWWRSEVYRRRRITGWREQLLYLFPNGRQTLTAMMERLRTEPADDPMFEWFERESKGGR